MRIEPAAALSLAAFIRNDLQAIAGIEAHASRLPPTGLTRAEVESLGFALHNVYNALENSFTQISLSFENHIRDQNRWHRELLEKMFFDLGSLRSAVLAPSVRPLLSDLLGFRHLFRHAYDFTLDERRTADLWKRWQLEGPAVKDGLAGFAALLAALGEPENH